MKKKKNKKKNQKLPKELIILENADKVWHESWGKGRDMLNIPHPYRAVCLGKPNSGKSLVVKNLMLRADPPFEEIFVVHADADNTLEYDDVSAQMLSEIPNPEDWEGEVKTLVVLDDLELQQASKDQKRNLDRLFGYCSTHKNISVILCSQDPFAVPTIVRRCSNLWVLWKMEDNDSMGTVARKTGMKSSDFKSIFKQLMPKVTDSLWIDLTKNSPYPLRKNGYEIISNEEEEELIK